MRRFTTLIISVLVSPLLWAEDQPYRASATARAATTSAACDAAFAEAEAKALAAFEADFLSEARPSARQIELRERTDERLPADAQNAQPGCKVDASWAAIAVSSAADEPIEQSVRIEFIDGEYNAECSSADQAAACKRRIQTEAAGDLRNQMRSEDANSLNGYRLEFDGFEGDQTFTRKNDRTELTMSGRFYFKRVKTDIGPIRPPASTRGDLQIERKEKDSDDDNLDVTIFYTWDGNNSAAPDDLALSANRWGLGLWVNNRIGVSSFWGEERAGTANDNHYVRNSGGSYDVFGIGLGYRVFDSRDMTIENTLYFVDAEPFSTTLDSGRSYQADDYVQAGINIKTNTATGPNVGWMFTWKLRPDLSDYDSLSGGWYLEWQF